MTTVGYGDRVPRSALARVFSVFWILAGITITSIYIAEITSNIIDTQKIKEPDLSGKRVGVLKNALHDSIMIAQNGGIVHTFDFNNTMSGIVDMMRMVESNGIDGFLLTRPMYYYFARKIAEQDKYKEMKQYYEGIQLIRSEKFFRQGHLTTGMLVRRKSDYDFFSKYFKDNWLVIQGCYAINLNSKEKKYHYTPPNLVIGLFIPFLVGSLAIVGFIVLFGAFYEGWRNSKRSPNTDIDQSN